MEATNLDPDHHRAKESLMKKPKDTSGNNAIISNVTDSTELKYWAKKFGCSRDEIRLAVKEAGDSLAAVERHIALIMC